MIEKILFEYYIDGSEYEMFLLAWDKVTITNKNIYVCGTGRHAWREKFERYLKKAGKKNRICLLDDLSEIYNENLEIINKYEELKNKFLTYLNNNK